MIDLRERFRSRADAFGAWLMLREPLLAEVASKAGYDYVCIDLQHGLAGFGELDGLLQAVLLGDAVPLVRVPWNEHWMIGRALDAGALGVIVPMVNTADEAARAAAACRYAPAGNRSVGPLAAGVRHGGAYTATADQRVMCIVMIETAQAVANLDEILSVPGVDAVYVGPSDLSLTLGLAPAPDQTDPRFHDALSTIVQACERHGVVPGVHANTSLAPARLASGFRMVTVGFDHAAALESLRSDLAAVRPT